MAVFINEFHYDNLGADTGEFVEIAGEAGTSLSGYSIVLYNGGNGQAYNTLALGGVIPAQENGFGTLSFAYPDTASGTIQNGAPDGIALIGPSGVIEFISYEGSFVATNGPASGRTSIDVGVAEAGTANGTSIGRFGTGTEANDFAWKLYAGNSAGGVNADQDFGAGATVSVGNAMVVEGDSGITGLAFTVTRTSGTGSATVAYATADGTATAGQDYGATSGTITFAPGELSRTVTVPVTGDTAVEGDETVTLTLSDPSAGLALGTASGTGTIVNDDTAPAAPAAPAVAPFINEFHYDNSGADVGEFVEIAGPAGLDLTGYSIVLYNGANGQSYNTLALSGVIPGQENGFGTLSFAYPDTAAGTIQNGSPDGIALVGPGGVLEFVSYEGAFTATNGPASGRTSVDVGVSEPGTAGGTSIGRVGTGDNGADFGWKLYAQNSAGSVNADQDFVAAGPQVSVNDVTVIEGDDGTTTATFTVTRTGPAGAFTIDYATADGTATAADGDYAPASGRLSFAAGETSKQVTVAINGDTRAEATESFVLNLGNATAGASIADGQGVGTITNDDGVAPTVSIGDARVTEGNNGTTDAVFTVTRTSGAGTLTVDYATASATAVVGEDFVGGSGTLVFAPGVLTQDIRVAVNGDTLSEGNERFFVTLSGATGGTIADGLGEGTIVNDDLTLISQIQGSAFYSPILAADGILALNTRSLTEVTVQAVVTGIDTSGTGQGFFLMEEQADWDASLLTSEGIFVLGAPPSGVTVGETVTLTARVMEYQFNAGNLPRTTLVDWTLVAQSDTLTALPTYVLDGSAGKAIPNSILTDEVPNYLDSVDDPNDTFDPANDALDFFETIEGMRVTVPDMVVAGGALAGDGAADAVRVKAYSLVHADADQINSRGGYTIAGDPPLSPPDTADDAQDRTIYGGRHLHDGDTNPDILELDFGEAGRRGTADIDQALTMGDRLGDVTGIFDFDFQEAKLYVTDPISFTDTQPVQETLTLADDARSLRVATFNVENLDPTDDANNDEADVNGTGKFNDLARAIARNLKAPDIISIEEIQDNNGAAAGDGRSSTGTDASVTWTKLVTALNTQTGLNYQWVDEAPVYNAEGGEPGGNIRVGFLYNTARVQLGDLAADATIAERRQFTDRIGDARRDAGDRIAFSDDQLGSEINTADWAGTRKSLLGEFTFNGNTVYVAANHFPSKGGSGQFWQADQTIDAGQPANAGWAQRTAIANDLYSMLDRIGATDDDARVIAGGDFNDFYFYRPLEVATGYVNVDGSARVGGIRLDNLTVTELPEAERYTYSFDGRAQAIDHILVDQVLGGVASYDVVHINTGYNERAGAVNPALSDHDPAVAQFDLRDLGERLNGTAAGELLEGFGGNDTLLGGAGADTLSGGRGDDRLVGGADGDLALFSGARGDYAVARGADGSIVVTDGVAARDGQDVLIGVEQVRFAGGTALTIEQLFAGVSRSGTSARDVLTGTALDDQLRGLAGNDVLTGLDGFDTLWGGAGNDVLDGGAGDDRFHGGAGDDSIAGGDGADYIVGGVGNDRLTGGAGGDVFVFGRNEGRDTITDYAPGQDVIHLVTGVAVSTTSVGDVDGDGVADLRLTLTGGGQVTVLGIADPARLTVLVNQTAQIGDFG